PALQALERSLDIDRRNPLTHYRAGLGHEAAGRKGDAMRAFENALSLDPEFEPARQKIRP
ncbi:MAG: tetratricopeptide repeat protein, partial [Gemmatimonadetes bacterium]|nr:tetratricopeptide repeat protein [Gemmatimonadota bacterium]